MSDIAEVFYLRYRPRDTVCERCGTVFPKKCPTQRFCSDACRAGGVSVCRHCGQEFEPHDTDQRFCSRSCAAAWRSAHIRHLQEAPVP